MKLLDLARQVEEAKEEHEFQKLATETAYKALQDARSEFVAAMTKMGTKSFKSTDGRLTASLKEVPKYEYDPNKKLDTIEWIELNLIDPYTYLSVDRVAFKNILTQAVDRQVTVPGVSATTTESLSFTIKSEKEED
jgi:hypothetical protein